MSKPEFVYTTYIASTPEKVFEALTDARMSERYWHGNSVVSDWKVGSAYGFTNQGKPMVEGKVLICDPPRRVLRWLPLDNRPVPSEILNAGNRA